MNKITITVTAEDIKDAREKIKAGGMPSVSCPIVLASRRVLKDETLHYGRLVCKHILPKRARQFVYDFDGRKPVKPFSFTITAPAA